MKHYDLCVIGAGPSGYAAAMRAVDFGKNVLIIERKQVGGAGITNGARDIFIDAVRVAFGLLFIGWHPEIRLQQKKNQKGGC